MAKYTIVFIRHGESRWDQENRFCGWHDADLSETGLEEAKKGAQMLKDKGFTFDVAFTSVLKRAIKTLNIVLDEMDLDWIPVHKHWRLNERMYGGLQGLNKAETAAKHGEDQVKVWRRSYDIPPPVLDLKTDQGQKHNPANDRRYSDVDKSLLPITECLKDTVIRVLPYWFDQIVPAIKSGKRVVISAHGNSLRGLVKYLDNVPDDVIPNTNIPTGIPLVYELDEELNAVKHYYLADEAEVKAAMERVANQGKAK